MEEMIRIEWKYTPENYFACSLEEDRETFKLRIGDGKVTATLLPSIYDQDVRVLDTIHEEVRALFLGVQVASHEPFELSKYTLFREHPDGSADIAVFPDSCVLELKTGTVDLVLSDSAGNIISDTRADRIREELEFARLSAKHSKTDTTVRRMLSSYESAVNDPSNELVHLYEIKDALKTRFHNEKNAKRLLSSINAVDWSRLEALTNDSSLKQGRHRGLNLESLRDATPEELGEARQIAKRMVLVYLKYIDRPPLTLEGTPFDQ